MTGVQSGAAVLAAVEAARDCLLLLDYQMPDTDGRTLIAELRRCGLDVPFIVMTGHGDERIAVEMMKLGARDYLIKEPDFLALLPSVVERTLGEIDVARRLAEAETELARYRGQLEELVRSRTLELEAANRELEAFSYSVSHDLRAPLRAIDGFSKALVEDYGPQLDSVARGYLDRVGGAARRMAELIDDLLNLARIARLPLSLQPVNLSRIVEAAVAELRVAEPARNVELAVQDDVTVRADPTLAAMVLQNLAGNAWKFTSKHESAHIEFGETRLDGERVFFVRDNGAGFDMTYMDKLFSPFQRLHANRDFAGAGIGLATVQRIVRRHGGRVWIEGAVEKGATCFFTFGPESKEA